MAVITRITTQKKSKQRYHVYIDRGYGEEFGFGVGEDVLVAFALAKGKEIDEKELKDIVFEDDVKTALNLAVNFLSYRMRSEKEIRDYLQKKDIASDVAEQVLPRLTRLGYVDDAEFAKTFVRSRKRTSSKGPAVIHRELQQKGIAASHILAALEDYSFAEQVETAVALATKQARRKMNKSNAETKQSIYQTLAGKGFSRDVIESALNRADLNKSEEDEWRILVTQAERAHRKYKAYEGWEYERRMKQFLYRKGFPLHLIERYLTGDHHP